MGRFSKAVLALAVVLSTVGGASAALAADSTDSVGSYWDVTYSASYTSFAIGYGTAHVWAPQLRPAEGRTTLSVRLKDLGGATDWSKIIVRPQNAESAAVSIAAYGRPGAAWQDVQIPLTAFPSGSFDNISNIGLFNTGNAGTHIAIASISFTGGPTPFTWFGSPNKTDNAVDATQVTAVERTDGARETPACTGTQPSADFDAWAVAGTAPLTVIFKDRSHWAHDWSWDLPGANPAVSTDPQPTVVYSTPGVYDVTQTVIGQGNCRNTVSKRGFITVLNADGSSPIKTEIGTATTIVNMPVTTAKAPPTTVSPTTTTTTATTSATPTAPAPVVTVVPKKKSMRSPMRPSGLRLTSTVRIVGSSVV